MQCINHHGLSAGFHSVPDPRRLQGRRYPVAAILTVAVAAILAKHTSVLAIAEWAADQPPELRQQLGFPTGTTPHQSTFQRLFRRLDPYQVAAALSQALTGIRPAVPPVRGAHGVAIDGKAQRGRLAFATEPQSCVHALSAVCHIHGVVLAQVPITSTAEKSEAALTVALDLGGKAEHALHLFNQSTSETTGESTNTLTTHGYISYKQITSYGTQPTPRRGSARAGHRRFGNPGTGDRRHSRQCILCRVSGHHGQIPPLLGR